MPFYLGSKLPNLVEVSDFSRACELDMETTFDKFDPASNSLQDHVVGWVVGDRPKGQCDLSFRAEVRGLSQNTLTKCYPLHIDHLRGRS